MTVQPERLEPVVLAGDPPDGESLDCLRALVDDVPVPVNTILEHLCELGRATRAHANEVSRWSLLATVAAIDLTVARVLEPHLDALTILDEAHSPVALDADGLRWGVYAAEGPERLYANHSGNRWELSGIKPWCSLADRLDRALVTAWTSPDTRRLFAIDLTDPRIAVGTEAWVARGLTAVASPSIHCESAAAIPVGGDGWYLTRAGFATGGIRVAAVWFGGAVGIGRVLRRRSDRDDLDQIGRMHLGAVDEALHRGRCVLNDAAARVEADDTDGAVLAWHVRRGMRGVAEEVMTRAAHAMGPGPAVHDARYAALVADLSVYLQQEHADRDAAALGQAVADGRGLVI
ncbi:acyl-CoA dehydrogenase [Gordonia sp. VNQ95]|jgi:hypothetical protein|uniref:acyl-CoA dehydrogenase n=1 Tax=Gordonia TaxID=2053 RepID=UPI0032B3996E